MYSKRLKALGIISLVIALAVTMTACDMAEEPADEVSPGEFIVTVDTSEMDDTGDASGQDIGTQSVAEERFENYEIHVLIVEPGDDFVEDNIIGHDNKQVDYGEEAVLSVDNLEPGTYDTKVVYDAELKDPYHGAVADDEYHKKIAASEEKEITISDTETTTADLTLNLLKGYVEVHIDEGFPEEAPESLIINEENVVIEDIDEDNPWIIVSPDDFDINPWLNNLEFTWEDDDGNTHTRSFEFAGIPNFTKIVQIFYSEGRINFNVSYDFPAEKPEIETLNVDENDNFVLEWTHDLSGLEDDDDKAFRILRTELVEETDYREKYSKVATVEDPDKDNGKFVYTDDSDEIVEGSVYRYAVAAVEQDENRTSDIAESELGSIGSYFVVEIDHETTYQEFEDGIKQGEELNVVCEVKNIGTETDVQNIWLTMHAPIHPEYEWDHIFEKKLEKELKLGAGKSVELEGIFDYPGPADAETNIHVDSHDHMDRFHLDDKQIEDYIEPDDRKLTVNSSFDDETKTEFTLYVDGEEEKKEVDAINDKDIGIASHLKLELADFPEGDYDFIGWFLDEDDEDIISDEKVIEGYMPTEDMKITAEFEDKNN